MYNSIHIIIRVFKGAKMYGAFPLVCKSLNFQSCWGKKYSLTDGICELAATISKNNYPSVAIMKISNYLMFTFISDRLLLPMIWDSYTFLLDGLVVLQMDQFWGTALYPNFCLNSWNWRMQNSSQIPTIL